MSSHAAKVAKAARAHPLGRERPRSARVSQQGPHIEPPKNGSPAMAPAGAELGQHPQQSPGKLREVVHSMHAPGGTLKCDARRRAEAVRWGGTCTHRFDDSKHGAAIEFLQAEVLHVLARSALHPPRTLSLSRVVTHVIRLKIQRKIQKHPAIEGPATAVSMDGRTSAAAAAAVADEVRAGRPTQRTSISPETRAASCRRTRHDRRLIAGPSAGPVATGGVASGRPLNHPPPCVGTCTF